MTHLPLNLSLLGFQPDPVVCLLPQTVQVYAVGGAVRDALMGQPSSDKDWVVVGAKPEDLLALGFKPVGSDFPVFLHPVSKEEYALARTERKSGLGYKGFTFYADPCVTLEQDLARRDFTLNAMAMSSQGQLIDPYGGLLDLQRKRMRHVGPSFVEDPLRVLRLARFLARFSDFSVSPETFELSQTLCNRGELRHLVAERVFAELNKGMGEKKPSSMIVLLNELNAWGQLAVDCRVPFSGFDSAALECLNSIESVQERWVYSLGFFLNSAQIKALSRAWRLPSILMQLSVAASQLVQFIRQGRFDAVQCGQLFSQIDLYRKPSRLKSLNRLVQHVLGEAPLHGFIQTIVMELEQGNYHNFLSAKLANQQTDGHLAHVAAQARQDWLNQIHAHYFQHT